MAGDDGGARVDDQVAWGEVYDSLTAARAGAPLDVEDLERLAEAAFFVGRDDESLQAWEDAHQVWVRLRDPDRAARCAFWLGLALLLRGEGARANGWFGRGRRLVASVRPPCAGYGYLLVPEAMEAIDSGDPARGLRLYEEAGEIAARCGDRDLAAIALLGAGEAAIAAGDSKTGTALLDEVMVSATTGDVSPLLTGILYCAVIDACVKVFDLSRAAEWTDALDRWCERQRDLVPYRGQCLVHRSQVLQAHGAWPEALAEAARAQERLTDPPHPAVGIAYYQQAELHRLTGQFAEAERAYQRASEHGRPATPGLALLRLAEGRLDGAVAAVRRMQQESTDVPGRLAVLPAFAEIVLAAGDADAARVASDELTAIASTIESPFVRAVAEHVDASVLAAEGRAAEALDVARRAGAAWRTLGMPYELARSQVVVAQACRALGDLDAATFELEAARAAFSRLGAAPDVARLDEPSSPRPAPATELSARECEVLRLVAAGKTNRDIGAALTISEHTVARHVQNIFTKLGLSSRAAATAYAYEHGIV